MIAASRLTIALCALYGAAGVGLMAAGTHAAGTNATIAGQMLLFHASAGIAATLARKAGFLSAGVGRIALALMLAGGAGVSAAPALTAFKGARLFPMAAPTGGVGMIAGWALLALAALIPARA